MFENVFDIKNQPFPWTFSRKLRLKQLFRPQSYRMVQILPVGALNLQDWNLSLQVCPPHLVCTLVLTAPKQLIWLNSKFIIATTPQPFNGLSWVCNLRCLVVMRNEEKHMHKHTSTKHAVNKIRTHRKCFTVLWSWVIRGEKTG